MINISYNLSSVLKENLQKSDTLRKNILLSPITRKFEIQLKWNCLIQRIYYSLLLSNFSVKKSEVIKGAEFFSEKDIRRRKNISSGERRIILYKKTLDYVWQYWLVTKKNVSVKDILTIYDIFGEGELNVPRKDIEGLLEYIQVQEDHPVIKAGIAYIGLQELQPFSSGNGRLARILAYIFLLKYGYDVRGFMGFEENWLEKKNEYEEAVRIGIAASSKTIWLEFFSKSVIVHLERIYKKIQDESAAFIEKESSLWKLSDRQREILSLLERPDSSITNKKVQSFFKISQITASRDLAKLATLGLLFSHGKGRSVYYTRA